MLVISVKTRYFLCVFLITTIGRTVEDKLPNIVFMLVDDLGWFDVSYHGAKINTDNIDSLSKEGIILDNYYVQPICTPTRSALMSGRYPIHTGLQHGIIYPPSPSGLPLHFKILPEKLKEVGYATHMVGKWHLGFYKWDYTPTFRGFDSFLGFYCGAEHFYTHQILGYLDFRDGRRILKEENGTYATDVYTKRTQEIIRSHDHSKPLFLYLPFQNVHDPLEAPSEYIEKYSFITDKTRQIHAAKIDYTDKAIGNITRTLKETGLWENTLLIFSTDNGGIHLYGGYNWPLRGEKTTLWEGGVRGVAFVSGGLVPRKGVVCKELLHVTDWYPTLTHLAGCSDKNDAIDGVDVWKTIAYDQPSPRTEILHNIDLPNNATSAPGYEGIAVRMGDMKLMLNVPNSTWYIPPEMKDDTTCCKTDGTTTVITEALYNITADPTERTDLSSKYPDLVHKMKDRVQYYMKGLVPPIMKPNDPTAYETAKKNGAWSPWEE
ncbi:arylsulfatase B-like [Actinia tenebrosa]|uniref:Arylsulfatase B-like n=1 Tax=Actinia tenebrosa TaxID=6105 RepID=A0A6P8I0D7_ACTTE|nr:arylsulfatase B-like [Actinia tenebrosa]